MLDKLGNKNFTLLARMMDLHSANHRVIAQNVANVNTPNYRRRVFRFEEALQEAMNRGSARDYQGVKGWVERPNTTTVRNNGNNVDIDMEMMTLNENANLYNIYSSIYRQKAQVLKSAIRGGR